MPKHSTSPTKPLKQLWGNGHAHRKECHGCRYMLHDFGFGKHRRSRQGRGDGECPPQDRIFDNGHPNTSLAKRVCKIFRSKKIGEITGIEVTPRRSQSLAAGPYVGWHFPSSDSAAATDWPGLPAGTAVLCLRPPAMQPAVVRAARIGRSSLTPMRTSAEAAPASKQNRAARSMDVRNLCWSGTVQTQIQGKSVREPRGRPEHRLKSRQSPLAD